MTLRRTDNAQVIPIPWGGSGDHRLLLWGISHRPGGETSDPPLPIFEQHNSDHSGVARCGISKCSLFPLLYFKLIDRIRIAFL